MKCHQERDGSQNDGRERQAEIQQQVDGDQKWIAALALFIERKLGEIFHV